MKKNLMKKVIIFRLFFIQFLIISLFATSLVPQACFCGEACPHGLQGKTKARLGFLFHARCSGTQCKSCNFEDLQSFKASNVAHSTEKLKSLNTPFILSNFSDCRINANFIKIFLFRPDRFVKVQSPPTYLQNLSLLL